MDGATSGRMMGTERLDLGSSFTDVELGEGVSRAEGGQVVLERLESIRLEARQQGAEPPPNRPELLTSLG